MLLGQHRAKQKAWTLILFPFLLLGPTTETAYNDYKTVVLAKP
jgi:hypothetical protein